MEKQQIPEAVVSAVAEEKTAASPAVRTSEEAALSETPDSAAETAVQPSAPLAEKTADADTPVDKKQALWREDFQLTKDELIRCLNRTHFRRPGKGRLLVESALLLLVGGYSLSGYLTDESRPTASLALAIISALALLLLLGLPPLQTRLFAAKEARQKKTMTIRGFENCLGFGRGKQFGTATPDRFVARAYEDMIILQFAAGRIVAIPRRAVKEETWSWLQERLSFVNVPRQPKGT